MKNNRIVIVQCRLSSTRLPQKALYPLNEKPLLAWALQAMKKVDAKYYYVATDNASYEKILPVCKENGFECFKGSADDVLKRFCDLLDTLPDAQIVIRATADNPFLFYEAANESVKDFEKLNEKEKTCDYLTYSGLPHGSGVEIFSASSLKKAIKETDSPYDHEHVGPSLYKHTDRYECKFIPSPAKYNYPSYRTTIDTYSDYLRALAIINYIHKDGPFNFEDIIRAVKNERVENPVILVPSVKKGQGTGHLHRMLSLALKNDWFIYIPKDKTLKECDDLVNEYVERGLNKKFVISSLPDETYMPLYITDAFKMDEKDYEKLKINKGIISLDEGGEYKDKSDYLLDIIPSIESGNKDHLVNKTNPLLIEKPLHTRDKVNFMEDKNLVKSVLICLGGEDPSGFTIPVVSCVKDYFTDAKITAVCPGGFSENNEKLCFVKNIPSLKEKLYEYDIVITHYGLTAFEAALSGCAVILLPTTPLHLALAKKYGYSYIENTDFTKEDIEKAFLNKNLYPDIKNAKLSAQKKDVNTYTSDNEEKEENDLTSFSKLFMHARKMGCPVCSKGVSEGINKDEIVSRNSTRTYRRCSKCGMVYMSYTIQKLMHYEKAYFFEDYKKQYGKTYEEDFENIKNQGLRRVENIKSIVKGGVENKDVLDIGCAYGPFLAACKDNGMTPYGTDISSDAVKYVKNRLNFTAVESKFPDIDNQKEFGKKEFDIVSMWYVIEHFNDLDSVLKKVSESVKKGGVFAFSTPCGEGVSCKSDKHHFYTISPSDHYSVWEISKASKILNLYGFEVKKVVSTGHHPERFPFVKKHNIKKGSFLWNVIGFISRKRRLGDTVEFYCRKVR